MVAAKAELWDTWIEETLLEDIHTPDQPDPVPFLTTVDGELTTTDALDTYRYGKNDGEYLYLIYLTDEPINDAADILPVYVGESRNIGSRIYQHYKKIDDALPIDDWEDDGSWGSFSKYDHIAAVREAADSRLYVWILDVETLDTGPYGVETYRQELEAKLIGLIYANSEYRPFMTNREFVPNQILHEIGKVGQGWFTTDSPLASTADSTPQDEPRPTQSSKGDLWTQWLEAHVYPDFVDESTADPIPLFETDDQLQVELTDLGRLKRSATIDERIRAEGRKCVHSDGVKDNGYEGLLYLMYQLAESDEHDRPMVVPRYVGKAEAYGKKRELSSNFTEIASERDVTRSFARWGNGDYWHVGELSMALFEDDTRKLPWASELFEQGTHRLKEQTYLWTRAWNQEQHTGLYGYDAYLAEVEPQLIGVAQAAYPDHLLNKSDVPDDAPIKTAEYRFESVR
ncbi:GIY-YIG nuclease family protein [Natrinema gelatinilyticum]|uniref:GIY-YIG nuclease family protein n=1 Tax=Natrinema gelatinilyticum TaxID=2961571 RepID=UPI0020C30AB7|nr:GIY-YIG nuclease family protein [Natrinema gelatinilyticum]